MDISSDRNLVHASPLATRIDHHFVCMPQAILTLTKDRPRCGLHAEQEKRKQLHHLNYAKGASARELLFQLLAFGREVNDCLLRVTSPVIRGGS